MLLLVLILVLLAFGLLVVALLTGGVLWAWVSVGVSVAAAAVLVVDWLQRRSAVRAGAEPADLAPVASGGHVPPPPALHDEPVAETATEVLPVVPGHGRPDGQTVTYGDASEITAVHPRDERADAREGAVLRGLPPSGSTGQPSGAHGGTGVGGPFSSPSVTGDRADAFGGGSHSAYADGPAGDTVRVSGVGGRGPGDRDEGPGGATGRGVSEAVSGPPPGAAPTELPPPGPDGAPPEEPHDPEAAAVVATLDDEVVVVDELPRYHVGGCPSLAGTPVIPLPVREAVELGFTPCAWCAPNRTLAGRHRASLR